MSAEAREPTIPQTFQQENEQTDAQTLIERHLDWSDQQRRILTSNGQADEFYSADRGYAFEASELPHHYLQLGTTRKVFRQWKEQDDDRQQEIPIVGAWRRTLFFSNGRSGWEFSSHHTERVFNVQTRTLFVDLRVPHSRDALLTKKSRFLTGRIVRSLEDLSAEELRWYARQHVFAGYSRCYRPSAHGIGDADSRAAVGASRKSPVASMAGCCTRHHCIDWNFVGVPRSRPNKWWIETPSVSPPHSCGTLPCMWREWAYAKSDHGQFYYGEQWERLIEPDGNGIPPVVLAFRLLPSEDNPHRDGVLVCVGDHFNYCIELTSRSILGLESSQYDDCPSLIAVVDKAVQRQDWATARRFLSLQGGHGRLSQDWTIDCSIEFWREGSSFWSPSDIEVQGASLDHCTLTHRGDDWEIFECSLRSIPELMSFLRIPQASPSHKPIVKLPRLSK